MSARAVDMSDTTSGRVLDLLKIAPFRRVWGSRTIATAGNALTLVGMPMAVFAIGGSPYDLGIILTSGAITEIALILAGGVWADRLPRGRLMVAVDAAMCAMVGTLSVLLLTGQARVYHFAFVAVLSAVGRALYRPAVAGMVASTVPAHLLQKADALLTFSTNGSSVLGPAIAGFVILLGNPGWIYAVNAMTFAFSALLLLGVKLPATRPPASTFRRDLHDGWLEVRSRSWLWQNLVSHGLWNFGFAMIFVIGPAVIVGTVAGITAWAAFSLCITLGGLAGSALALRLRVRRPLVTGNLFLVGGALPFIAIGADMPLPVILAGAFAAAGGLSVLGSLWNSTLQQLVPLDRLSRVTAYDWMASLSITPLAYAAAAPLRDLTGTRSTVLLCAALIAVPSALVVFLPGIRSIRSAYVR